MSCGEDQVCDTHKLALEGCWFKWQRIRVWDFSHGIDTSFMAWSCMVTDFSGRVEVTLRTTSSDLVSCDCFRWRVDSVMIVLSIFGMLHILVDGYLCMRIFWLWPFLTPLYVLRNFVMSFLAMTYSATRGWGYGILLTKTAFFRSNTTGTGNLECGCAGTPTWTRACCMQCWMALLSSHDFVWVDRQFRN